MFRQPAPNPAGHLVVVVGGVRTSTHFFSDFLLIYRFFAGRAKNMIFQGSDGETLKARFFRGLRRRNAKKRDFFEGSGGEALKNTILLRVPAANR